MALALSMAVGQTAGEHQEAYGPRGAPGRLEGQCGGRQGRFLGHTWKGRAATRGRAAAGGRAGELSGGPLCKTSMTEASLVAKGRSGGTLVVGLGRGRAPGGSPGGAVGEKGRAWAPAGGKSAGRGCGWVCPAAGTGSRVTALQAREPGAGAAFAARGSETGVPGGTDPSEGPSPLPF